MVVVALPSLARLDLVAVVAATRTWRECASAVVEKSAIRDALPGTVQWEFRSFGSLARTRIPVVLVVVAVRMKKTTTKKKKKQYQQLLLVSLGNHLGGIRDFAKIDAVVMLLLLIQVTSRQRSKLVLRAKRRLAWNGLVELCHLE